MGVTRRIMYDNEAYTVRKISLLNTSLLDFWNRPSTVLNSSIMYKVPLPLNERALPSIFTRVP
jgi:hypothetical protein